MVQGVSTGWTGTIANQGNTRTWTCWSAYLTAYMCKW
jgi:hypothetical protein